MQVERLASGLRHEPAFVASALDVSSSEAATFVSNMLQVDSVPSVLLYPEAARGCLKFLGALLFSEHRFLGATAYAYARELSCGRGTCCRGHCQHLVLTRPGVLLLLPLSLAAGPDMSAAGMLAAINKARKKALPGTPSSPGAVEWQLIEAATPLSVTALRAAAASGDREAVVAALQQQMQPIQPTPLALQQVGCLWSGLVRSCVFLQVVKY